MISPLKEILNKSQYGKGLGNLYAHLWIIYLIFLPIACYIDPVKYPGDSLTFFKNITSLACTYNTEQWFLLPYLILVLISNFLFNVVRKARASLIIISSLGLFVFYCYLMAIVGGNVLIQELGIFYQLLLVFGFLFTFCLGALANKCHWVEFTQKYISKIGNAKVISTTLIFILICVRFFIHNQSLQPFCVLILFLLFPFLPIKNWCKQVLMYFGKHSMNMWLIQTWFCYYLFKDFIYGFKYPIIIFIVTTVLSLLTSVVVEHIYKWLASWFAKVRVAIK